LLFEVIERWNIEPHIVLFLKHGSNILYDVAQQKIYLESP
jgi:hypothetical protein